MAYTGPTKFVQIFVVTPADVADNTFEANQLNAGHLPPMKFGGDCVPFYSVGVDLEGATFAANQALVTAAAATSEATGWALANANKAAINGVIAKLITAGLMDSGV